MPEGSGSQRTSIALFLATAGIMGGSAAIHAAASDVAPLASIPAQRAQLLAEGVPCVPVGEGENCERETRNKRKQRSIDDPAPTDSSPNSNPGASEGSAADELKLIEQGDI